MDVQGTCLCGECAWTAEVDPKRIFICHCTDCQVVSGSAFRTTALIASESFAMTKGELRSFVKTTENGSPRELGFCPTCGTHVFGRPPDGGPGAMSLRVGSLAQRAELVPVAGVWCRSRRDWLDGLADMPGLDTQPGVQPKRD
jgi:hypothetical protein